MSFIQSSIYLVKRALLGVVSAFGFVLISKDGHSELEFRSKLSKLNQIWQEIRGKSWIDEARWPQLVMESKSQLGQDLMALHFFGCEGKGFFVEFGATDGISGSNTFLLEKALGWSGILAEPAKKWHKDLQRNRNSKLDFRCVYAESNLKIEFQEVGGGLSTIKHFSTRDIHAENRKESIVYRVKTVSLNGLLEDHSAPDHIDFLSIDTEGSEFEILSSLNFQKYSFGFICVEHNHTENKQKIESLLNSRGYKAVYSKLSEFDGWFIPNRPD